MSEQICKPNFVPAKAGGNHSSGPAVTGRLKRPTRKRCQPESRRSDGQPDTRFPIWSCTTRSLPGRACYQIRAGELLPHRFTHHLFRGWSALCCTCRHPRIAGARMLSGSLPCGVRTFLSFSQATARSAPIKGNESIAKIVEHQNASDLCKRKIWREQMCPIFLNRLVKRFFNLLHR